MKPGFNRRRAASNDAGLPFQQTSLTSFDQSTVENQVEDLYNGYGQLIQQYQEINGAVNPATSQSVQYGYTQIGNANPLTSMTYPDGRREDFECYSGLDTAISRVRGIADDGGSGAGVIAAYAYLGLNTIVQEVEPQANVELTYIQVPGDTHSISDGGDRYTGLDRFGRVIDQAYYVTTSPPSAPTFLDRIQYGYDRDGNTLYANNLVNGSFSELYHANSTTSGDNNTAYDPLNRLTSFSRGTLTASGNNGTSPDTITSANLNSTPNVPNQNSWNYDALGNWNSGNGANNTFNAQNEETTNGASTLAYDNAGDMTTDEIGNTYLFDAWGHVVQIKNSSGASLETFQFDALGRNVVGNNGGGNVQITYDTAGRQVQSTFGSIYSQYVWGLAYVNDLVLRDRNADGNLSTGNLGVNGSGLEEREYAQHDRQFSVISLTNQTGTVIQRIAYDPYGKFTVLTATWTYDSTGGGTNYWFVLFQGMSFVADGASGNLLQSEGRFYNMTVGRWISQDWARYVDGSNLYQALRSNPVGRTDPRGTSPGGGSDFARGGRGGGIDWSNGDGWGWRENGGGGYGPIQSGNGDGVGFTGGGGDFGPIPANPGGGSGGSPFSNTPVTGGGGYDFSPTGAPMTGSSGINGSDFCPDPVTESPGAPQPPPNTPRFAPNSPDTPSVPAVPPPGPSSPPVSPPAPPPSTPPSWWHRLLNSIPDEIDIGPIMPDFFLHDWSQDGHHQTMA